LVIFVLSKTLQGCLEWVISCLHCTWFFLRQWHNKTRGLEAATASKYLWAVPSGKQSVGCFYLVNNKFSIFAHLRDEKIEQLSSGCVGGKFPFGSIATLPNSKLPVFPSKPRNPKDDFTISTDSVLTRVTLSRPSD
jgi:hypothetical protein